MSKLFLLFFLYINLFLKLTKNLLFLSYCLRIWNLGLNHISHFAKGQFWLINCLLFCYCIGYFMVNCNFSLSLDFKARIFLIIYCCLIMLGFYLVDTRSWLSIGMRLHLRKRIIDISQIHLPMYLFTNILLSILLEVDRIINEIFEGYLQPILM